MKDVISRDRLRGAANRPRSEDFRMGQPLTVNSVRSGSEFIGAGSDTEGSETSQYLEEEKTKIFPQ